METGRTIARLSGLFRYLSGCGCRWKSQFQCCDIGGVDVVGCVAACGITNYPGGWMPLADGMSQPADL